MLANGTYPKYWTPGIGEVVTISRMPRGVQEFLADASREDPEFVDGYLIPVLWDDPDPCGRIVEDLTNAVADFHCQVAGLGELGYLGKSFFKKVGKAIKKVATAPIKIAKKEVKALEKAGHAVAKVGTKAVQSVERVGRAASKTIKKVWIKYGPIILVVVGGVLTALLGPAGAAIGSILQTANTAYMKKRQADRAKKAGAANAAEMEADAAAADAALNRQLDDFYDHNRSWYIQNGMTPENWAKLNTRQKIDFTEAASKGQLPSGATQVPEGTSPGSGPPSGGSGGGYAPSGGGGGGGGYSPSGGGGGGGDVWGGQGIGPSGGAGSAPTGGAQQPATVQAGMFGDMGGMLLPALALGAAVMFFGKPVGGGGSKRRRRNPSRRRRRCVA